MPFDWDAYSKHYDNLTKLVAYQNLISQIVKNIQKFQPEPVSLLDLGCGTGNLTTSLIETFPDSKINAVDYNEHMLKIAKDKLGEKDNVEVSFFDITDQKSWDSIGKFSVIVLNNVLYTIEDKEDALRKLSSKIEHSGILLISDPKPPQDYSYRGIVRRQFSSAGDLIKSIKLLPSFYNIYRINKEIDSSYTRLDESQYKALFEKVGLGIKHTESSYAGQASLFVLERSNV